MLLMKHSRSSENAIFQGFVEFRYNLGSGPAILRSLRKVTDVILLKVLYCHKNLEYCLLCLVVWWLTWMYLKSWKSCNAIRTWKMLKQFRLFLLDLTGSLERFVFATKTWWQTWLNWKSCKTCTAIRKIGWKTCTAKWIHSGRNDDGRICFASVIRLWISIYHVDGWRNVYCKRWECVLQKAFS